MKVNLLIVITVCCYGCSPNNGNPVISNTTSLEKAKCDYSILKGKWEQLHKQLSGSSNISAYWKDSFGSQIIAGGKRYLPFIMQEIEDGNFLYNHAAEEITGLNLREEGVVHSEQYYSSMWVKWWHINRNNPQWNIYANMTNK